MANLKMAPKADIPFPSSNRSSLYSASSNNSTESIAPPPLPYLPFRRISLPSLPPPSPLRRQSTQQRSSIASFESDEIQEHPESTQMARTPRKGPRRTAKSMQLLPPIYRKSHSLISLPLSDPLLVKRRQVILEFYETEKAYVQGLDLIHEHFLLPILNSLETPTPILERPLLTAVFSNFIDVWNLHRSLYNELDNLFFSPNGPREEFPSSPPPLSPALLAHFPYLSLYTPFVTAFPQTLATLNILLTPSHFYRQKPRAQSRAAAARVQSTPSSASASPAKGTELKYEKRFADFVATQENDPRCGRLKLRDWLLTIVQRCPRYLLLLGDLLSCSPGEAQVPLEGGKEAMEQMREKMEKERRKWHREATKEEEKEREKLILAFRLISKITNSLNTSISLHSQTLSLLALQRATPNLPLDEFQFISPGRTLLKRGTLLQIENSDARVMRGESKTGDMYPREREFLLFSDCLVWLASEEVEKKESSFDWDLSSIWSSFSGAIAERPKSTALVQPTQSIVEEEEVTGDDFQSSVAPASAVPRALKRPVMTRTRSKSEAEVTALQAQVAVATMSNDSNLPALPSDKVTRRPTHKSNFARINKSSALHLHFQNKRGRKNSSSSPISASYGVLDEVRWLYKGRIELVNLDIVVDTSVGIEEDDEEDKNDNEVEWRWEVLSPEGSFVLYAASAQDRNEWTTLIRQAKSQHLVSLNAQHPNSTLTSSAATHHVRRALQALPFPPNDIRMKEGTVNKRLSGLSADSGNGGSFDDRGESGMQGDNPKRSKKSGPNPKPAWYNERRSKVDHWVPAIWIPDDKAEGCMRCGRAFGWRRRRHHCRLCGRCVCSSCSEKTFYISDPNAKDQSTSSKPARACNACYESVFPLMNLHSDPEDGESTVRARRHALPSPRSPESGTMASSIIPQSTTVTSYASNADTITSLSHLPSWMTMSVPSLALSSTSNPTAQKKSKGKEPPGPEALMAIDSKRYSYSADQRQQFSGNARSSRDSGVVFDLDSSTDGITVEIDDLMQPARSGSRIKLRSQSSSGSRPKSYHEILDDFNSADNGQAQSRTLTASPLEETSEYEDGEGSGVYGDGEDSSAISSSSVTSSRRHTTVNLSTSSSSVSLSTSLPISSGALLPRKGKGPLSGALVIERKEDTVRRNKRFSMPAVALQTTSVVARTQSVLPQSSVMHERSVIFAPSSFLSRKNEEGKRYPGNKIGGNSNLLPGMPGTRSKRFSLVLGGRQGSHIIGRDEHASISSRRPDKRAGHTQGTNLGKGVAASRLNELLGKSKQD